VVTVYYAWIPDNLGPAREARWLRELPDEKREVIRRTRFARGRVASLAGLQLLKRGMQEFGFDDFELRTVSFPRGGKPRCALPVDFNISHSGDLVACALSDESNVGVDVEKLRDIRIEAFQRFLSARERAWVGDDGRRFLKLWTQKEAVVKGDGRGGIAKLRKAMIEQGMGMLEDQPWHLRELSLHPDYVAHAAIDRETRAAIETTCLALDA
jgi:4'-phosphopantetheinyl transferase